MNTEITLDTAHSLEAGDRIMFTDGRRYFTIIALEGATATVEPWEPPASEALVLGIIIGAAHAVAFGAWLAGWIFNR